MKKRLIPADWRDHLFVHEYGHYIQSQILGYRYFPVIAIPSLVSAAFTSRWSGVRHTERWFEVSASKLGANYFDKHYGSGKAGYSPNSQDYFNINKFIKGEYLYSEYESTNQDMFPVNNPSLVIWDFIF